MIPDPRFFDTGRTIPSEDELIEEDATADDESDDGDMPPLADCESEAELVEASGADDGDNDDDDDAFDDEWQSSYAPCRGEREAVLGGSSSRQEPIPTRGLR